MFSRKVVRGQSISLYPKTAIINLISFDQIYFLIYKTPVNYYLFLERVEVTVNRGNPN